MSHDDETAKYTPTEIEIVAACERIKAARLAVMLASQHDYTHGAPREKRVSMYRRTRDQ